MEVDCVNDYTDYLYNDITFMQMYVKGLFHHILKIQYKNIRTPSWI